MRLLGCLVISGAILVLFCLGAMQAFRINPFMQTHLVHVAAGFAAVGLILCLAGRSPSPEEENAGTTRGPLRFLGRLHYWGPMCIVCGGIVAGQRYLPQVLSHPMLKGRVASVSHVFDSGLAKIKTKEKHTSAPKLKLQGIFYRRPPSAIMNGQLVYVGDRLGAVKVVSIEQHGVTVEQSGQTTLLVMGK